MSEKPTPESVREALEHTYHSAWNSEAFQREGMNAQRKYQADAVLRWLWEEWSRDKKVKHLFTYAMRCADVLYGEGEK